MTCGGTLPSRTKRPTASIASGQKNSVSAYKLITLNTIEEKIAEMQKRKKGLVKKVVSCDDEAIAKLTWEDVLELLKT